MPSKNKVFCSGKCQKNWRKGKTLKEIFGEFKANKIYKNLQNARLITKKRVEVKCNFCNKIKFMTPGRAKKAKYCTYHCANSSHPTWNKGKKSSKNHKKNMRIARLNYISKVSNAGLPVHPNVGMYEKPILDNLEEWFDYPILRQFKIGGYFVDGYCYELNLVIEVDEIQHKYKKERDKERQDFIQSELSCKFLRIPVEEI